MTELINLSTRDFVRREGDDNEPVQYRGDLGEQQAISFTRRLAWWPWGSVEASLTDGQITINNQEGRYDQMIFRDMRDQELAINIPLQGGSTIRALTAIVDRVEALDDRTLDVYVKDMLTLLDVPLQTKTFGDEADVEVLGRPLPITLGVVRSIRPPIWEADSPSEDGAVALRIHDEPLSGVTNVRVKGEFQFPTISPPDFVLDGRIGNAGILLAEEPAGLVTVDASTSGDAIIPAEPVRVFDGDADFNEPFPTVDNSNPNALTGYGWNSGGGTPAVPREFKFKAGSSQFEPGGELVAGRNQSGYALIYTTDRVLKAGKSYRWRIRLCRPVEHATHAVNVIASMGNFRMRAMHTQVTDYLNFNPGGGITLFSRSTYGADNVPGVYEGTYTVPSWTDRYVHFVCVNGGVVTFAEVEFTELPEPIPDDLIGIPLKDYVIEVVRRAGIPVDIVDTDSIDAVDPVGEQIGFYADRPITALSALRAPLDSFGADVYVDRLGFYRFARIRDPEPEIPSRVIDKDNITFESTPLVRPDTAKGLTTTMTAGQQYHVYRDSDFSDATGLTLAEKQSLQRPARFIRSAVLPGASDDAGTGTGSVGDTLGDFPRLYRHAVNAEPLHSLFDEAESASAEIQRVTDIYSVVRRFVDVEIYLDPGDFVELDEVVLFKYPRYGFDEGRNMIVVGVTDVVEERGGRRWCRLMLWG